MNISSLNKIEKGHTFRHRALRHLGVNNYLKTYFPAIWPFAERQRVKKREGDPNSVANIFHNLKLILCDYTDHWNNVFWLFRSKEVTCSHIRVISPYSVIHFNMIRFHLPSKNLNSSPSAISVAVNKQKVCTKAMSVLVFHTEYQKPS